ncbi:hypothetical protein D3C75_1365530 [compost metagenome]
MPRNISSLEDYMLAIHHIVEIPFESNGCDRNCRISVKLIGMHQIDAFSADDLFAFKFAFV